MKFFSRIALISMMVTVVQMMFFASCITGAEKESVKAASVDGAIITEEQLRAEAADEMEALELQNLRSAASYARKQHEALEKSLENLLEAKLLDMEAAKEKVSREQLIDQAIKQKVPEPTDEDVDIFYEINRSRINGSKEELAPQIKKLLRSRDEKELRKAFLDKLAAEHKVERFLEPFRYDVKTGGRPALGPESAPVRLILFSDFQCPYCQDYGETLKEVVQNYGDKVQLVFRQFPLTSIHQNAQRAAEASLCANDQNHFWEMHDAMFENQENLKEDNIILLAKNVGLDEEAFKTCLTSSRHKADVKEDIRAGSIVGTEGTPTLFINGRYLTGGQPYGAIAAIIDEELAKKKP